MGIKWSFSRISTFLKCPYKYYLKYIRKIYIYSPNNNFVIGNAFGEFVEEWSKNKNLSLVDSFKIYLKCCTSHKYKGDMNELKYLSYIVEQFYEQNKRINPLIIENVVAVEFEVIFSIIDEIFEGKIDVIDENGGILDYKTSNKLYTLDDLNVKSDKGLQLYIYALGYVRKFKKLPPYIGFVVVLKENPIYVQRITKKITLEELKIAKKYLEEILLNILSAKSFKKNICGLCDYCDYLDTHCEGRPYSKRKYFKGVKK